jgi:hypothetical protein
MAELPKSKTVARLQRMGIGYPKLSGRLKRKWVKKHVRGEEEEGVPYKTKRSTKTRKRHGMKTREAEEKGHAQRKQMSFKFEATIRERMLALLGES